MKISEKQLMAMMYWLNLISFFEGMMLTEEGREEVRQLIHDINYQQPEELIDITDDDK